MTKRNSLTVSNNYRLPWRRYALNSNEQSQQESEEEVEGSTSPIHAPNIYEEDLDECDSNYWNNEKIENQIFLLYDYMRHSNVLWEHEEEWMKRLLTYEGHFNDHDWNFAYNLFKWSTVIINNVIYLCCIIELWNNLFCKLMYDNPRYVSIIMSTFM